jgi:phosphoglycerol transferase MdoB-like AlkP superfamily enzyme
MSIIVILLGIILVLFGLAYFTKRRFGALGLALTAGFLLSSMWTTEVRDFIEGAGVQLLFPPLSSVVSACLIVLPALVLLFSGPTYSKKSQRLIGAGLFAVLTVAFLLTPLAGALTLDDSSQAVFDTLYKYRELIITVGVIYALYDVFVHKTSKKKDKEKD